MTFKTLICMKRFFLSSLVFVFIIFSLSSQSATELESSIFNDLNSAYNSKFYPGVVQKAEELEKNYPQSSFVVTANCKKGESFFYLHQYENAIKTLEGVLPKTDELLSEKISSFYFLAKSYQKMQNYEDAIKNYLKCAEFSKNQNSFYEKSIYNAGLSYFSLLDFGNAKTNFEYVVSNGKKFSKNEYEEALQKLCICYQSQKEYKKIIDIFNQLKKENLNKKTYFTICIYSADSYKKLGENLKAYENYCNAIESGITEIAIIALKKAYVLSSEKNIGVNPSEIFSKTTQTFSNESELVREFWCRLAIDEFNKQNYEKSLIFFENAEKTEPIKQTALQTLYKAKIKIESEKDFLSAEKILIENEDLLLEDKYSVSDSWFSTLLSCKINLEKWNEVLSVYEKIKNPKINEKYNLATFYYQDKNYEKVVSILEEIVTNDKNQKYPKCAALYSSSLLKIGENAKACKIYEKFYLKGNLDSKDKIEYSKALFLLKSYEKANEVASSSNLNEGNYISGLCFVNLQDFSNANKKFINYIKNKNQTKNFNNLSYFYKGYCEYCLEDYKNAYLSFLRFLNEEKNPTYKFAKNSYEFAATSALQTKNYDEAAIRAENLFKISATQNEKQNALFFLVDIYCDMKNYQKAIEILNPYTTSNSDFKINALFKTAQVYENQNDLQKADEIYQKIYKEYAKTEFAQDALFRSGEIFYSTQDYASSQKRFNEYIYKFTDGKYYESALFFCGDCDLKLKKFDESVMMNSTLLSSFPNSTYGFSANKNLLETYEKQENFLKALEIAKRIVTNYPEEANFNKIGTKLIQLEKIVSGTDKSIVEKLSEYENAGKSQTFEGRKIGTELVKLYEKDDSTLLDAANLSEEILKNHKENSKEEFEIAAFNAEFLGNFYQKNYDDKKAAQFYLDAAQFYRSVQNNDLAATCLYNAAECFYSAKLGGDAKNTAELLQKLYPNSKQANIAQRFLN